MLDKIIKYIILITFFALPLFFLPFAFDILDFAKQTLVISSALLLLLLNSIKIAIDGRVNLRFNRFHLVLLAILVSAILSSIFSDNRLVSLLGFGANRSFSLSSIGGFVVILFYGSQFFNSPRQLIRILLPSLCIAVLFGAYQFIALFLGYLPIIGNRGFNTIGSINMLALLGAISVPLLLGAIVDEKKSLFKYIYLFFVFLIFILICLLNWWPLWIVFAGGLGSLVFISVHKKEIRIFSLLLPIIFLSIGGFLMLTDFHSQKLKNFLPFEVGPSYRTSFDIAVQSLKSKPQGFGSEIFPIAFDLYKPVGLANSIFYDVRFSDSASEFYNIIIEKGLLGLGLIIFLIFVLLRYLSSNIAYISQNHLIYAWASLISFSVAFFLYPINMGILSFAFALLLIVMIDEKSSDIHFVMDINGGSKSRLMIPITIALILIGSLFGLYYTGRNFGGNIVFAEANNTSDISKKTDLLRKSLSIAPYDSKFFRVLLRNLSDTLISDLKKQPSPSDRPKYLAQIGERAEEIKKLSDRLIDLNDSDSQNWLERGIALKSVIGILDNADKDVLDSLNKAIELNPNNPSAYNEIGLVYLQFALAVNDIAMSENRKEYKAKIIDEGRKYLKNAEDSFQKSLKIYNNFPVALYNLATVYDKQGRLKDATSQLEILVGSNKDDAGLLFQLGVLYYRANRFDEAFSAWNRAIQIFPNYSNARWYLSFIYEKRGDIDQAIKQIEAVARLNPNNEIIDQRLRSLKENLDSNLESDPI